jgi:hypothetical protein
MRNSRIIMLGLMGFILFYFIALRSCPPGAGGGGVTGDLLGSPHIVDAKFSGFMCNCSSLQREAAAEALRFAARSPAVECPPVPAAQSLRCPPPDKCPACPSLSCPDPPPCDAKPKDTFHPMAKFVRDQDQPAQPPSEMQNTLSVDRPLSQGVYRAPYQPMDPHPVPEPERRLSDQFPPRARKAFTVDTPTTKSLMHCYQSSDWAEICVYNLLCTDGEKVIA